MLERPKKRPSIAAIAFALCGILALSGCSSADPNTKYPEYGSRKVVKNNRGANGGGSVFGDGGLFGDKTQQDDSGGGVGVNSFLWRASLDTVSFMPLASADPFGGVILTDWYSPPQTPNERFKVQVYILDRTLRADGIRVSVFREENLSGRWVTSQASPNTATDIENAILTKARQLRIAQGGV